MITEKTQLTQNSLEDLEAPIVDLSLEEAAAVEGGQMATRGVIAIADGSVMPMEELSFNYQKVKYSSSP